MKTWTNRLLYIVPAFIIFYGCAPEIDVPAPSSGGIDFSNYIAVGNSLTAGYADRGLYEDGQMQSYPSQIAQQMSAITPIEFKQPDIPGNGSGYLYLESLAPEIGEIDEDPNWLDQLEGPFNNLGVPGIRVKDIMFPGYGSSPQVNPYFYRMLGGKSPLTTYLEVVQESAPTFFTCWMGNNDVLGYATSGGIAGIDGAPGTGLGGLTDPVTEFKPLYDAMIAALTSQNGKGVVITIPDISLAPFFTTVPWNGLVLTEEFAEQANQAYAALITIGLISEFKAGPNPFVIEVPVSVSNPVGISQMKDGEFMLLTALLDGQLEGQKALEPKPTQYILTSDEVKNINDFTDAYNDIIRSYASSSDIAFFESNDALIIVKNGVFIDGVNVNSGFVTGGAFSLDAIHLTPRGYAIVANGIIQTINKEFNASISPVNINNYRAVILP